MGLHNFERLLSMIIAVSLFLWTRDVQAQAVTVQQPVVRSFSTATTVSVPDRGSMHLGSLGSASTGRATSGPFRPGTSSGTERSGSSMRVSVFIHDLQAMDEALLAQGSTGSEPAPWSARLNERRAATSRSPVAVSPEENRSEAARYEQLARDAETRQKLSTARLHWQMAAKLGSPIAKQRLASIKP